MNVETEDIDDHFVQVRVKDNGPGIRNRELKQIFKRFYRVSGPLATRVKGTGLGLFIVRSVAKRHAAACGPKAKAPAAAARSSCSFPSPEMSPPTASSSSKTNSI